jgi:tRNA(Ile)-lysidine synthase
MRSAKRIINKAKETIFKYGMISKGDRVVVAVSGGQDSACLLDILSQLKESLGIELIVAHFDHGLRPYEDDDETRFVDSLAKSHGLSFETKKASPDLASGDPSVEERARDARYRFLEQAADKFSAQKIALGHNLNDQAETVLMRLLRGSGPSGLSGIPPLRDEKIIRPLIEISRADIEYYIEENRLEYITDSSNFETRFLRNSIRLELLPQLEEYQPRIVEILAQTADIIREDNARLEAEAEDWFNKMALTGDGRIQLPIFPLMKLTNVLKRRVIRLGLKKAGGSLRRITLKHITAINQLAMGKRPQGRVNLPNHLMVERKYDQLIFGSMRKDEKSKGFSYALKTYGTYALSHLGCSVTLEELTKRPQEDMGASPWIGFFDAKGITFPLMIRNFLPGDRFIPFGMEGHKKVKDFFIDLKIPSSARHRIPILTYKNKPIWICGLRIDDRFKVRSDTEKVLKIMFRWPHKAPPIP